MKSRSSPDLVYSFAALPEVIYCAPHYLRTLDTLYQIEGLQNWVCNSQNLSARLPQNKVSKNLYSDSSSLYEAQRQVLCIQWPFTSTGLPFIYPTTTFPYYSSELHYRLVTMVSEHAQEYFDQLIYLGYQTSSNSRRIMVLQQTRDIVFGARCLAQPGP